MENVENLYFPSAIKFVPLHLLAWMAQALETTTPQTLPRHPDYGYIPPGSPGCWK